MAFVDAWNLACVKSQHSDNLLLLKQVHASKTKSSLMS